MGAAPPPIFNEPEGDHFWFHEFFFAHITLALNQNGSGLAPLS